MSQPPKARAGDRSGHSRPNLRRLELLVTVFLTGAVVMTIEIVGTRIVGPVFGVGLFVWSALLAVTLGSLATGYYVGGVAVDRWHHPRLLGLAVTGSGVLLGLVGLVDRAVLRAAAALGPREGPLVAAALLFAPSLIALGTTGPIAVRLSTADLRAAGRSVGLVYAVSTAGSLLGTLLVGFVVVPSFDTDRIVTGAAAILTLTGALPLALRARPAALAATFVPALAWGNGGPPLPLGLHVLDRAQSLYGLVEVIDDTNRGVRFLRADHSIIGAEYSRDQTAAFAFLHILEAVRFLRPDAKSLLEIGLGIGSLPSVLQARGMVADVVEIDPAVVRFAQEYFDFRARGEIYVQDARAFLEETRRHYDLIVHDTFTGGSTPPHLLSLEVMQRLHARLRPGAVLALNFAGYREGPKAEASFAVARTVRGVFAHVRAFWDGPLEAHPGEPGNIVFFASDGPLVFDIPDHAQFENDVCERTQRAFLHWEMLKHVPEGPLITDAINPLARLQLPISVDHFNAMSELLPLEVWLN